MMKAWGSGDEKVVAKNFELLFNTVRSEDQARDPELPRHWQSKRSLGSGVRGPLFKKVHPLPHRKCPSGWGPPPSDAGQRLRGECGEWGRAPPHRCCHPPRGAPPPDSRDISGCHLSSFLCLSEDYEVAVQAGTALGEAGEARWDTIQLQRGDTLLMVATSRHHGLPALPDTKDGLRGFFFNLWTPDPRHRHHQPNTTHLDPTPP